MRTVLVVDDDKEFASLLCEILETDYSVHYASNGKKALECLAVENNIELVITDIFMPEKEGIETIQEIIETYPHIKIIAMSGGGNLSNGKRPFYDALHIAEKLGADKILKKPFKSALLIDAIKELIGE